METLLRFTPMMEQYRSMKKTLSEDTVLFFRLGDFYEMFFEDAVRASEILNITLTGRDAGPAGRVPMCGIPYHAFGPYVRALLGKNLKVAICEQIGDPQISKGLVERKVTRIISPATYLDDEVAGSRPEYLVAVAADPTNAAWAALDLGTGEFFVREAPLERMIHELAGIEPKEAILPKRLSANPALVSTLKEDLGAALTIYDDWIFGWEEGSRLLRDGFSLASERAIAFHDRELAVGAAGAVLYYLKDHLYHDLRHVQLPVLRASHERMTLDRQTLRNLEIVSCLSGDRGGGCLLDCVDQTLTPMGKRALLDWVTHPLLDLKQIQDRQEATAGLVQEASLLQTIRSGLKGIRDIERVLSRLNVGVANARDLVQLRFFLRRIPEIEAALSKGRSSFLYVSGCASGQSRNVPSVSEGFLQELRSRMSPSATPYDLLARAIVEDPPLTLREGGMIRDGFSKELDELKALTAQGKSWLIEFQRRQIERTGIKSLKIRYSHLFGYAIEVSAANLPLVPPDYIRKQTLVNAERFIVPELKEWDERIAGAEERIKELELRLFQEIREEVLQALNPLQEMARAVGRLDAVSSLSLTAIQKRWVRPIVTDSLELEIKEGRHPVVESVLPAGQFVENDTTLDGQENQLLILTGPNMAGKSTTIRQVAQIVLLAQIGSFVPASFARIGLVDRIFTRIGASDSIARGESTFMVEMIEMAQILQSATERSLLLLDEVGRGTSTFDGVSLAWAICEHLVQGPVRPRTLFATHYHELIQLESQWAGIKNYTMAVKETGQGIVFLRKLIRGGSDKSYGIHVARLAGVPSQVTDRAEQILKILERDRNF